MANVLQNEGISFSMQKKKQKDKNRALKLKRIFLLVRGAKGTVTCAAATFMRNQLYRLTTEKETFEIDPFQKEKNIKESTQLTKSL